MQNSSRFGVVQAGGSHYQIPYQPIDFIVKYSIPYLRGCILKYIVRAPKKHGAADIDKALSLLPALAHEDFAPIEKDAAWQFADANKGFLSPLQTAAIETVFANEPAPVKDIEIALLRLQVEVLKMLLTPRIVETLPKAQPAG